MGTKNKTEEIKIRVTADEKNKIFELADKAGLTVSDYVRISSLSEHEIYKEVIWKHGTNTTKKKLS